MIIRYSVDDNHHTRVLHGSNIGVLIAANSAESDWEEERKKEERIKKTLKVCRKSERERDGKE